MAFAKKSRKVHFLVLGLDDIIRETIEGMKEKAAEIGLKGNLP